jgi:agmatine deiminase
MPMPAEWEPHERCLMAWPTRQRTDLWGAAFEEAMDEYAGVANAVAAFEPVTMLAAPGEAGGARARLASEVEIAEVPIDDSWTRDSGPIFVRDGDGRRAGVDFRFNSWGERYLPYDKDAASAAAALELLGFPRIASDLVLEGGAITVDGEGTLITTEQCVLNANRNPEWSKAQVEAELRSRLGVETVIWLPYGSKLGVTDGHVDGVCVFARPGTVLLRMPAEPDDPDHERMRENRRVLEAARDARGRALEIVELPHHPVAEVDGVTARVRYINFYVANGGIVVPLAGHPLDAPALEGLRDVFPDREVVGMPAAVIGYGGGGVHCITQQVPA